MMGMIAGCMLMLGNAPVIVSMLLEFRLQLFR